MAKAEFERGPINMGAWSRPVNAFACIYLLFICSAAVLPTEFPVTRQSLNYAPIAWGIVVAFALLIWSVLFTLTTSGCLTFPTPK